MTTKPVALPPDSGAIIKFPDPPPEEMTAYHHVLFPGYPGSLALHFGNRETTVILSEIAAALFVNRNREGIRYPDLLIAFDANPAAILPRNGYLIPEQGKPPDFVLEVASESTGKIDEDQKRRDYAGMGVPEYWRFDYTGGNFHSVPLAGDRLVDGEYQPVAITRIDDEHYWGHSEALNLDLCWEQGDLRWFDPVEQRYLPTFDDERTARIVAETQRDAAEAERNAAEARIRQLEEKLQRRQDTDTP